MKLLIGNPNVGKTTIFNNLTNSNAAVSNYDGVTVEVKRGMSKIYNSEIFDLPGINSLNANTPLEKIVNKTLLTYVYDEIIYVADINSLQKNLLLLIDILELQKKTQVLLNMNDLFEGTLNIDEIEKRLSVKCNKISNKNKIVLDISTHENNFSLKYHDLIEQFIDEIIKNRNTIECDINNRYLALQFIQSNESVYKYFDNISGLEKSKFELDQYIKKNKVAFSLNGLIFLCKRQFLISILKNNYQLINYKANNSFINKYLDKIALHKVFGFVLFVFVMWLVFFISFQLAFLGDYISMFFVGLQNFLDPYIQNEILKSFLFEGVLAGISSILTFLPQIIILFALLTLLESSGYFARVSVLFSKMFNRLGLSAHSLIPLISGFGCNVLSIMSTRIIKNDSKRLATIYAAPFISCSARFPVYIIFINIFFTENKALVLLSLYFLGIIVAITVAYLIDKIIYNNKEKIEIISLPSYKKVDFKYFVRAIKAKVKTFLLKAGKLIFIGTMVIWILIHFSTTGYTDIISDSIIYQISDMLSFVFTPIGFGNPEAFGSLVAAFLAKELAIPSMQTMYGVSTITELSNVIQSTFTSASAYSYLVFTLLYTPCISTLGAIYAETGHKKHVVYSLILSLLIGYGLAYLVFIVI